MSTSFLHAAPSLNSSATFSAVELGRTYMDIGGAWNGSAEVQGDNFTATFSNAAGATTAFDFVAGVTLPSAMQLVNTPVVAGATWTGSGCPLTPPTVTAAQVGNDLQFSFSSVGFDLPGTCSFSVNFKAVAGVSVAAGTHNFIPYLRYADTDGGALNPFSSGTPLSVLVKQGERTITVLPASQIISTGASGTFTVKGCNTGFGALFDVDLTSVLSGLTFVSATQNIIDSTSSSVPMTGTWPNLRSPYVAVGKCFTIDVVAAVNSCANVGLSATIDDRVNAVTESGSSTVIVNPLTPNVGYTAPNLTVTSDGAWSAWQNVVVTNSGAGEARNLVIPTSVESFNVEIEVDSASSPNWHFNSSNGNFSYYTTAPGDLSLAPSASTTLRIRARKALTCAARPAQSGNVVWSANYTDTCGVAFVNPTDLASVVVPETQDPYTITKTINPPPPDVLRVLTGASYNWQIEYTPQLISSLNPSSSDVVIVDTLPTSAVLSAVSVGSPSAGTRVCAPNCTTPGATVTWTLSGADRLSSQTLGISFTTTTDECQAGNPVSNSITATNTVLDGVCSFNETSNSTYYLSHSSGTALPAYFVAGGVNGDFEPGVAADADHATFTDAVPNITEGEGSFLEYTNIITVPVSQSGTWAASEYRDNVGTNISPALTTQALVPLLGGEYAAEYRITPNGGSVSPWTQVPAASVLSAGGATPIRINLSGLTALDNNGTVAGDKVEIRYKTYLLDSDLDDGVSPNVRRSIVTTSVWDFSSGSSCGGKYITPIQYDIARRNDQLSIVLPPVMDVCRDQSATISAIPYPLSSSNERSYNNLPAWNPEMTLTPGNYTLFGVPVPSGVFSAANMNTPPGGPYTPVSPPFLPSGNGTVTQSLRVKANTVSPSPLNGALSFDSTGTILTAGNQYSNNGSGQPVLLRRANLEVTVSPQTYVVNGKDGSFNIYVVNAGDGPSQNTIVKNTLPAGLLPNASLSSPAPTMLGQEMTWNIGSLSPGQLVTITVGFDVDGSTCADLTSLNQVNVTWGCDGDIETADEVNLSQPNFTFSSGRLSVLHDTTVSTLSLCAPTTTNIVELSLKNTGIALVKDGVIEEVLNPSTSGVAFQPGTVSYKTYSGNTLIGTFTANPSYNPTGTGESGSPYRWTKLQIPQLSNLYPLTASGVGTPVTGPITEVRISFQATVGDLANTDPTLTANASGVLACGSSVASPGNSFTLPVKKPNMSVSKTGLNFTESGATQLESVYAAANDTLKWQIVINNNGTYSADNLRFTENVPNSPAGASYDLSCTDGTVASGLSDLSESTLLNLAMASGTTCTVTQVLGSVCVNENNLASIKWGCTSTSNLTSPTTSSDTAALVMSSVVPSTDIVQTWASLEGGRGRINITFTNSGAPVRNVVLTDTLPSGWEFDGSHPVAVGGTAGFVIGDLLATPADGTTAPAFSFTTTKLVRNTKTLTLSFGVIQNSSFDTTQNQDINPETVANSLDPEVPTFNSNQVKLDYTDSCATAPLSVTATTNLDPLTPDLDISVSPQNLTAAENTDYCFTYTITNNGDTGSVANGIEFFPTRGSGWAAHTSLADLRVVTPGVGGSGGTCGATCTPAQMGSLASGASATVAMCGKTTLAGSLTMKGEVQGNQLDHAGADTMNNYSLDTARARVVGMTVSKTVVSTSEAWTSCVGGGAEPCSGTTNLAVGEDIEHKLKVVWFGLDPADTVSSITLRDTVPTGMGYVSHTNQASHNVTYTPIAPSIGSGGAINFVVSNFSSPTGTATFEVNFITRLLNIVGNTAGTDRVNNWDAQFTLMSNPFCSSAFAGCASPDSNLTKSNTINVLRPSLSFDKKVRRISGGAFADNISSVADDDLEYQITISNAAGADRAPVFDLSLNDSLDSKLNLLSVTTDTVDNDGDGASDGSEAVCTTSPCEGHSTAGLGGSLSMNHDNTGMSTAPHPAVPGSAKSFFRLDPGQTLTLLYRADVDVSAIPTEVLENSARLIASTLPGANGSQTSNPGAPNSSTGEDIIKFNSDGDAESPAQVSNVTIDNASMSKSLVTTSINNDTVNTFMIGEQVHYRVDLVLPPGTSPSTTIKDAIPGGMRLVHVYTPLIGSGISGCTSQTTPVVPSNGAATITWTFGPSSCVVSAGASAADRTIRVEYVLQVRNISSVQNSTVLTNSAQFNINSVDSSAVSVAATAIEPNISVFTKVASPATNIDAGDEITYTLTVQNTGTAPAYDIAIQDTLPTGVSYVTGSTTLTTSSSLIASLNEPDVSGNPIKWGRLSVPVQVLNLLAGEEIVFTYKVKVDDVAEPGQVFTNAAVVNYTSTPSSMSPISGAPVLGSAGSDSGERDGSGGTNNYTLSDADTSALNANYSVLKAKSGDTVSGDGFRVGDIVTYTVTATLQQGSVDNYAIKDTLPLGLEYIDTQSVTASAAPVVYTGSPLTPSQVGQDLTWGFGRVTITGTTSLGTQNIVVVYRARVKNDLINIPAGGASQTKNNTATAVYDNSSGVAQTTAQSVAAILVKQPFLTFDKQLLSPVSGNVVAGDTVKYRILVTNTGTARAYNPRVVDTLPDGMRDASPATDSATAQLNGSAYSDAITNYSSGTGVAVWELKDTDAVNFIEPGQAWRLDYSVTIDSGVGAARTLTNSASLSNFYSKPASDTTERRSYAGPSGDSVSVTTPSPVGTSKTLNLPVSGNVTIGQAVRYTVRVPSSTLGAALYDVNVLDTLPTQLTNIVVTASLETADPSVVITDNTSGHSVSVNYSYIPANNQAVVQIDAVLADNVLNAETSTKTNTASYNWKSTPGSSLNSGTVSSNVNFTIVEPDLTVDKTFLSSTADPVFGLETGDYVVYRITVNNSSGENATAYDIQVDDVAGDPLLFDSIAVGSPNNPGSPTCSALTAGTRTCRWNIGNLNVGSSYVFDVRYQLGTVQPYRTLRNEANISYTSTSGSNANERTYTGSDSTPVDVTTGNVLFSKTLLGTDTSFNPGEELRYQLKVEPLGGVVRDLRIRDLLPSGLSYRGYVLTQSNVKVEGTSSTPVSISLDPTNPQDGTATLVFDLGDVESTGAAPHITIEVIARIDAIPANVSGVSIKNEAEIKFDDPDSTGTDITLGASEEPSVTVSEPILNLALDAPSNISLASAGTAHARLTNTGTGEAYQPVVRVDLPGPFNATDPQTITSIPIVVAISGGRTLTLNPSEYSINFTAGSTASFVITFIGANAYIAPGETLDVTFGIKPNNDTLDNTSGTLVGGISSYSSSNTSVAIDADNRVYSQAFDAGTVGTANGAVPDDYSDNAVIEVDSPDLTLSKAVSASDYNFTSSTAPHLLNYTITITNNGTAAAELSTFEDILSASHFKSSSLTNVNVLASDGSAGTLTSNATGGAGSGIIQYEDDSIAASSTVTITYQVEMRDYMPSGSIVTNSATMNVDGYTGTFVSDSTNSADDDAIDSALDSDSNLTNDDSTKTTITTRPLLSLQKTSSDLNGAPLNQSDVIEYTLVVNNTGTEHAINARILDSIPSNTSYVVGSTTLNGVAVADVSSVSPLAAGSGLLVEGVNGLVPDGSGWLKVGSSAVIRFRVTVNTVATSGTIISNQATLTAQGEGGQVLPSHPSDDPSTAPSGDPTINVVGNGPSLQTYKTARISNDLDSDNVLDPGEEIEWTIQILNTGSSTATGVSLTDSVPNSTEYNYLPSSIEYKSPGTGSFVSLSDAVDADSGDVSGALISARVGDLPAGQSAELKFKTSLQATIPVMSVISNQASVTASNFPTQNSDCDTNLANGTCPTEMIVGEAPLVRMTKVATDLNGGTLEAGDVVQYSVTIQNVGGTEAEDLYFRDPGPSSSTASALSYVASSSKVNGSSVADLTGDLPFNVAYPGYALGNLANGASVTITYQYRVPASPIDGTLFTNQAYFSASNITCPNTPTGNNECVSDSSRDDAIDLDGDGLTNDDDATVIGINANLDKAVVEGYVYLDDAHDRVRGVSDTGRSGWRVELYLCTNPASRLTTTTDSTGFYRINGIAPGSPYCVDFIHPETGVTFGRAQSTVPGVDLESSGIRQLNLAANTVTSEQNLVLDPMGIIYDSITRLPVAGVTVNLERETTPGVWSLVPTTDLLPGQQGQVTGSDGVYEFNLNRNLGTSNYRIVTINPSAYIAGYSNIIQDNDGAYTAGTYPSVVPSGALDIFAPPPSSVLANDSSIVYHTSFAASPSDSGYTDLIFNHLAIDPILDDAIIVTKRSSKTRVSAGSFVPYTITFKNNLPPGGVLNNIIMTDYMPPGFSYVAKSATINGVQVEPVINGRTLEWSNQGLATGETKTLNLILLAGLGVKESRYDNQGYAMHSVSGRRVSNVAVASVLITPDPVFDCPEIVGRVYDDKNRNGYWDEGEPGLAGAEVVTARGWRVKSDEFGRFHITCPMIPNPDIGSNFVIKLDPSSLPTGYRITTENPSVTRLTRGKMSKANFGASVHRVLRIELKSDAFVSQSGELKEEWKQGLEKSLSHLKGEYFKVHISYVTENAQELYASERMAWVKSFVNKLVKDLKLNADNVVENEEIWNGVRQ